MQKPNLVPEDSPEYPGIQNKFPDMLPCKNIAL